MTKSVEQKLYEAFCGNRGTMLTAADVEHLVVDDAVGTRISNAACLAAGVDKFGMDYIGGIRSILTWEEFVFAFREEAAGR